MTTFTPVGFTTTTPTYTDSVDQNFFVEPLSGPSNPTSYLDRFPDTIYNKAPDTHFVRFMYTLLGPSGVGWLRANSLKNRLELTENGFDAFDMERYYANPFRFGRVLAEQFEEDPYSLLTQEQWDVIKSKDESYRSRVIEFFNAARAGNTPFGMELAARSGLGHNVEIIENYKALFDAHSDSPKGFEFYGNTQSTSEFVVVPTLDISRSEQQKIDIQGSPTGGNFVLVFNGQTTSVLTVNTAAPNYPSAFDVQSALQALSNIGDDNVRVSGGPGVDGANNVYYEPYIVTFTGDLAGQNLPLIKAVNGLSGGVNPTINISTIQNGIPAVDEAVVIDPELRHNLQVALDYLKPVNTFPTIASGAGLRSTQVWRTVTATSEHHNVLRFVRGSTAIRWPKVNEYYWIEPGLEKQAPRTKSDLGTTHGASYTGFQNVSKIVAYTDNALDEIVAYQNGTVLADAWNGTFVPNITSEHVGSYSAEQINALPLRFESVNNTERLNADKALADYAEPLTVTSTTTSVSLVNGIYPADYASLQGVPEIKYKDDQFWGSAERSAGTDYLEIDLGVVQPVNFLAFEITNKPFDVAISYDALDAAPKRRFLDVSPVTGTQFPTAFRYTTEASKPWSYAEYNFTDSTENLIYTRFIRIAFSRIISTDSSTSFLYDPVKNVQYPFSVEIKNLRVGRHG